MGKAFYCTGSALDVKKGLEGIATGKNKIESVLQSNINSGNTSEMWSSISGHFSAARSNGSDSNERANTNKLCQLLARHEQ
jgi:hypothetical protein